MTPFVRRAMAFALAFAMVFALLLGLAACHRTPSDPNTITLAAWASPPGEALALDRAIAAFTAATGIKVKKEVITDKYMDVLRSRFASRNTPDVFYLDSHEAPFLIKSGVLSAFEGAQALADETDFYPQFLDPFRGADGRIYGAPKDYSSLALYINTGLLRKAGFKPADVPADMAGLMVFARRLQARLNALRLKGVGALIYEKDLARHLSAIEAYGQPVITPDGNADLARNLGARAYLEAFVEGRQAQAVFSPKDDLGADSPTAAFGAGKTVMALEGNWILGSLRDDYPELKFISREMPTVNGRPHTMAFVVGWAVSRYGKNPAGGFRFAQHMSSTGMKAWASESGTLPTRRSVQAQMDADGANLQMSAVLLAHTAGAPYATVWSRGTSLPVLNTNFGNQFLAAMNGSISVAEALTRAERASNREIERQR